MTALRSGEYAQTANRLAREVDGKRSYCCEGVAFERHGEALGFELTWDNNIVETGNVLMVARDRDYPLGNCSNAPRRFWRAMGLHVAEDEGFAFVMPNGLGIRDDDEAYVMHYFQLNDDKFTFNQIADLIEWQFLSHAEEG